MASPAFGTEKGVMARIRALGRWLLLTHEGRIAFVVVYCIFSVISIVTYTIMRSPLYGLGQVGLTVFGLFWANWCLGRVGTEPRG